VSGQRCNWCWRLSLVVGKGAAFEVDGECVEGWLPSVHPAGGALVGRVEGSDDKVEAFESGLLVKEVPAGSGRSSDTGVDGLDGVRRVDHAADLGWVVQEGHELSPRIIPQGSNSRVTITQLFGELLEADPSAGFADRAVRAAGLWPWFPSADGPRV
jgi:hypothetical protein